MVAHFTYDIINKVKDIPPEFAYACEPGGMGPSGIIVVYYMDYGFFIANQRRNDDPEYQKLIDEIFKYIPEARLAAGIPIKGTPYGKVKSNYELCSLGCGNYLFIKEDINDELHIETYRDFIEYLKDVLLGDVFKIANSDMSYKNTGAN